MRSIKVNFLNNSLGKRDPEARDRNKRRDDAGHHAFYEKKIFARRFSGKTAVAGRKPSHWAFAVFTT